MEPSSLHILLSELDSTVDGSLDEEAAFTKLRQLRKDNHDTRQPEDLDRELLAFAFNENCWELPERESAFYGPRTVLQGADGSLRDYPSLQDLDSSTIDYWRERAKACGNPVLQARYAGLAWEYGAKVPSTRLDYLDGVSHIEAILQIASSNLHPSILSISHKLNRAWQVARALNSQDLIERCSNAILAFESDVAVDGQPGTWGFAFSLIKKKKLPLTDSQRAKIVLEMEERFKRLSSSPSTVLLAEIAARHLVPHYRSEGALEQAQAVLGTLGDIYARIAQGQSAFVSVSHLYRAHAYYRQAGLKDKQDQMAIAIRDRGPDIIDDMKAIESKFEVETDRVKAHLAWIVSGTISDALSRLAHDYLPHRPDLESNLRDLARDAPLSMSSPTMIVDHEGRTVGRLGSLEDDFEGRLIDYAGKALAFNGWMLVKALGAIVEHHTVSANALLEHMFKSPAFSPNQDQILRRAFQAYLEGDHLVFVHLIVPQIEVILRHLLRLAGGNTYKPHPRSGSLHMKLLGDLLVDKLVLKAIGDDAALYLRVVLADQRSWNIRNRVSHGITDPHFFSEEKCARLMHIMLFLAEMRETTNGA